MSIQAIIEEAIGTVTEISTTEGKAVLPWGHREGVLRAKHKSLEPPSCGEPTPFKERTSKRKTLFSLKGNCPRVFPWKYTTYFLFCVFTIKKPPSFKYLKLFGDGHPTHYNSSSQGSGNTEEKGGRKLIKIQKSGKTVTKLCLYT